MDGTKNGRTLKGTDGELLEDGDSNNERERVNNQGQDDSIRRYRIQHIGLERMRCEGHIQRRKRV